MRKLTHKLKDHFIPHKGNDHEPHFLRHSAMTLLLCVVILIELAFLAEVFVFYKKESFLASVLPSVLTDLTNQARVQNGVEPLAENDLLKKAAELKAKDMAQKSYFAHTSPEGITPWYWLVKTKYKYAYAGENLAVNFFESADVARAWMASPTHRANIVRKEFTEIGIATASGVYQGHDAVFVVEFFGKPIDDTPKPILTDASPSLDTPANQNLSPKTQIAESKITQKVLGDETDSSEIKNSPIAEILPQEEIVLETVKTVNPEILKNTNQVVNDEIETNNFWTLLTSPFKATSYILYSILGLIFAVFAIFLWKSERKHPEVILRSLALMFVILTLLVLNLKTLHIDTILPDNSEVNAIAS